MRGKRPAHGLSLVEVCVALGIAAIAAALAVPTFGSLAERLRLQRAASQVAADLQFARAEAAFRDGGLRWEVQPVAGGTCTLVYRGPLGACHCDAQGQALCNAGGEALRSAAWPSDARLAVRANVASLLFDPLYGTASPAATLTVTDLQGRAIRHVVSLLGRIRSCAEPMAFGGVPAC